MTAKELNQLYYLNKEIDLYEREMRRLERSGIENPNEKIRLDDTLRVLGSLREDAAVKRMKILEYIRSVDDSYMRQILYWRNIRCKSWVAVGVKMNIPEDAVKKAYYRFVNNKH